jgi:hypothetical protein
VFLLCFALPNSVLKTNSFSIVCDFGRARR